MNQKELNKIFLLISNCMEPFGPHDLYRKYSALSGISTVTIAVNGESVNAD